MCWNIYKIRRKRVEIEYELEVKVSVKIDGVEVDDIYEEKGKGQIV